MGGRSIPAVTIVALLAVTVALSGCGLTGTPESGWVWPTTGPVTPAPTPVRVTPAVLPTPTARDLSPATTVPVTLTATSTVVPTETASIPTNTPTLAPTDTAIPPTEIPPAATEVPPTETPMAVPPTATVFLPTATPVRGTIIHPTPGVATAVATAIGPMPMPVAPTPTPAFLIAEPFITAWRNYPVEYDGTVTANPLGQPVEAPWSEQVSRQFFGPYRYGACTAGQALFLWRDSIDQIYFLVGDSAAGGCVDYWEAYADIWATGQGNNEDLTAPVGMYTPVMGFGRVWREYFHGRSDGGLDFAVTAEEYTTATVQRFENGTALYFPDTNEVYVLFPDYHALGPQGEFTYRAWFRNP